MCPPCVASVAMIVVSGAATRGLSALIRTLVRITSPKKFLKLEAQEKSRHENKQQRTSKELLIKEKQLTRQRDEVDRQRRELPWVKVEKEYVFEGPHGPETLADLFAGRS